MINHNGGRTHMLTLKTMSNYLTIKTYVSSFFRHILFVIMKSLDWTTWKFRRPNIFTTSAVTNFKPKFQVFLQSHRIIEKKVRTIAGARLKKLWETNWWLFHDIISLNISRVHFLRKINERIYKCNFLNVTQDAVRERISDSYRKGSPFVCAQKPDTII